MNKKAIFMMYLLIFTIVLCGIILYAFVTAEKNKLAVNLGESQLEIIHAYATAEQELYFIDQSVKYSAYKTLNEFYLNNGLYASTCTQIGDYPLLKFDNSACNINYSKEFLEYFNPILKQALPNYDFDLNQDSTCIIGQNKQPLMYQKNVQNVNFLFEKPIQFKVNINADISAYNDLKEQIRLKKDCFTTTDGQNCIQNDKFEVLVKKEANILKFDITPKQKIYSIKANQLSIDTPTIKFALELNEPWQTFWGVQ